MTSHQEPSKCCGMCNMATKTNRYAGCDNHNCPCHQGFRNGAPSNEEFDGHTPGKGERKGKISVQIVQTGKLSPEIEFLKKKAEEMGYDVNAPVLKNGEVPQEPQPVEEGPTDDEIRHAVSLLRKGELTQEFKKWLAQHDEKLLSSDRERCVERMEELHGQGWDNGRKYERERVRAGVELIICAAVKFDDKVVRGHRHSDCIHTAGRMGLDTRHRAADEGFITSKNRFVGRQEAKLIHHEAGQLPFRGEYQDEKELFSEDLY